jgi:hypothetical protein
MRVRVHHSMTAFSEPNPLQQRKDLAMDTTRPLKSMLGGALLFGSVAVTGIGLAPGTAQAQPSSLPPIHGLLPEGGLVPPGASGPYTCCPAMKRPDFTRRPVADARQMSTGTRTSATRGTASSGGMETLPRCLGKELTHRRRRRRRSHRAGFLSCVQEHRDQRLIALGVEPCTRPFGVARFSAA